MPMPNDDTVLGVVAERYYEVFNGEDAVETYWNLCRKVVLYDVPEKPWPNFIWQIQEFSF